MRVAVISDLHANLHALDAVLEDVTTEEPDAIWCLGDLVGYGPRPNECCAAIRERAELCLIGNHDLLALGETVLEDDFNADAAAAGRWTRSVLTAESTSFLETLEPQAQRQDIELFHASPRERLRSPPSRPPPRRSFSSATATCRWRSSSTRTGSQVGSRRRELRPILQVDAGS
jgi:3',5'-cyclic AMP phosphodiesterase CpdA